MILKYLIWLLSLTATVNSLSQCVSNYTDFGPTLMRQLYDKINQSECQLASNVNYLNYEPENFELFDFIVIGAGSAGSVIANRLSENKNWKVLVLEAGGDPTITSEIPAFLMLSWGTELDWTIKTEPESNIFLGYENRRNIWPRGKVLGGSSVLNFMQYLRGNPKDYDHWAALGNKEWSYNDLLPLFKKSEDMRDPEILSSPNFDKYHSKGGLLSIESFNYIDETGLINILKKGMKQLGYEYYSDVNADKQTGLFKIHGTLRNSKRCSAAKAFLLSAQNRPNLKISKYSEVSKILIENNLAHGVLFTNKKGQIKYVRTRREVILSAGSINSPKILMLSGVGPKDHLHEMKIKNIKNLKVGENFQDHVFFPFLFVTHNISTVPNSPIDQMYDFLVKSSGPLSNIGPTSYSAFINTSSEDYPDIQLITLNFGLNETGPIRTFWGNMGLSENNIRKIEKMNSKSPLLAIIVVLLRPKSRGRVLLKSSNYKTNPKVFSGFLSQNDDSEVILKGIEFVSNLIRTDAMKSIDARLNEIPMEECQGFPSREYWICLLRHFVTSGYHQSGTCKMGPSTDPDAVVDSRLRVNGINNLRVVDLSIVPRIVSTNTQAAAMVIGEKGAEMIKEDSV